MWKHLHKIYSNSPTCQKASSNNNTKKKKKEHPSSMLKEPPVLPALMVKVLHSQSVSVDDLPSFSKGSSEMLSDIRN